MIDEDFRERREAWTRERFEMCDQKSVTYTRGSVNRLDNFNRIANGRQVTRQQVLSIYLAKHLDAILDWIDNGRESKEGFAQNVFDAQNYLDLLLAMYAEDHLRASAQTHDEDVCADCPKHTIDYCPDGPNITDEVVP